MAGQIQPGFFFPCFYCADTTCNRILVPWVTDFQHVPATDVACVLAASFGIHAQGLYVRQPNGFWKIALSLENMTRYFTRVASVKIIATVTAPQTFGTGILVFLEGNQQTSNTVTVDASHPNNIWLVLTPEYIDAVDQGYVAPGGALGPTATTFTKPFLNQFSVTVDHNMLRYPAVQVADALGNEVEANIRFTTINQVLVSFAVASTGTVICN